MKIKNFYDITKSSFKLPSLEYKSKSIVEPEEFKGLCIFIALQFLALAILISLGASTWLQASQGAFVLTTVAILAIFRRLDLMKLVFIVGVTVVPCGIWVYYEHMPLTMPLYALAFPVYGIMTTSSYKWTACVFCCYAVVTVFIARPKVLDAYMFGSVDLMADMLDTLIIWSFVLSVMITYVIGFLLKAKAKTMIELEEKRIELELTNMKLKDLNRELKETLESKENLLLSISHEVRNPSNIINGCAELTLMRDLDEESRINVENIKASSELLTFFINNLLDASKMRRSELEVNRVPVKMSSFLERLWATSKILVAKKGLDGKIFIRKNFPKHLTMDPIRVLQIVYNLVSNAVKFTDSGYIAIVCSWINDDGELSIEHHIKPTNVSLFRQVLRNHCGVKNKILSKNDKKLWLNDKKLWQNDKGSETSLVQYENEEMNPLSNYSFSTRVKTISAVDLEERYSKIGLKEKNLHENKVLQRSTSRKKPTTYHNTDSRKTMGFLKIEVVDSGCDIPIHELSNLFKRFSQVGPNSHKQLGTGLGLWISQNLCQKMGGDLRAFSSENEGSVFVACLQCENCPVAGQT